MTTIRALLPVLIAVQAVSVGGGSAQEHSPGRRISIGDRSLWLACSGAGQPTVILEAGHTDSSITWGQVQPQIATFTRVCSYDRAGRGRSDRAIGSGRRGHDVVQDLHALLDASAERGPYLLVGHSLGGAFVRLYTAAYPGDVAGLILVDAVSEREHAAIDELLTPDQRAIGATMPPPQPEGIDIRAVYDELTSRARPLTVPLVVVARGQPLADDELPPSWSPEQRRRREDIRYASQVDMARLSPAGELIVAKGSGHFVHHEQPAIVIAAVRKLVGQRRKLR